MAPGPFGQGRVARDLRNVKIHKSLMIIPNSVIRSRSQTALPQPTMTGSLTQIATKLKAGVEASNAKIKADVGSRFQASAAKLEANLEELKAAPSASEAPAKPDSTGIWFLARKRWSWKYRD